jgi:dipeptidyl aminopeptidase/acylaminoacyl peptidase
MKIDMEDSLATHPLGFDKSGQVLYLADSRGRDTAALVAADLRTGESRVLAEDPRADAGGVLVHPSEYTVQAVSFNYTRQEWKILDPAVQPDFDFLRTVADGDLSITSRTLDDSKWTVAFVRDDGPVRYYVYDRTARSATFLFTNRTALEGQRLARMHPVVIRSRDGLDLVSYLTVPVWADPRGMGRPDRPLSMVLLVHGGPWARDG